VTLELVLATANAGKAAEISSIFSEALGDRVVLLPRPPDVPDVDETGLTLEDNARLKAQAIALATGLPAVADDTGLEVLALGGAPGVHSARYAGPDATPHDNIVKMLATLASVAPAERGARFRTVALVSWPSGRELVASGSVDGAIALAEQGDGGFGYDPIFVPGLADGGDPADGDGRTFAQLTSAEKNAISHRGGAFRALATLLAEAMGAEITE
jgi:XTP/dITP diphosphohydrolase